jgi:hypothetical protein
VLRYAPRMENPAPAPAPPAAPMRKRSLYMSAAVAERLDTAVDDIHYSTRRPKHEVLAAAVAVALDHRAEIEARLTRQDGAE